MTDSPHEQPSPDAAAPNSIGPKDQVGFEKLEPADEHPLKSEQDTAAQEPDKEKDQGFLDHLDDLRRTLIQATLAGFAATVICWFVSSDLLDILVRPIKDQGVYFTAPNEAFLVRLKLAAAMGLFLVAPFIFFRFYMFIMPGLYHKEKKVVTPLLIATSLLFYTGVSFGFLIVIPQVMVFLMSFGTAYLSPLIGIGAYFGFVSKLCLAFGLVFQLPLLVLFLSVIGVVSPRMLLRTWRYAILAIFALSALLTPPDVISQVMMAGPVLILYWSSVVVALVVTRKQRKDD